MCYKDTIEEKLKNVLKLSEEIQDTMDDEEFQEDFENILILRLVYFYLFIDIDI